MLDREKLRAEFREYINEASTKGKVESIDTNKQKGTFVTEIKVPLTDTNKEYYKKINVSHGDLKNSKYETYITGVNKDSMGYFIIELKSMVDSNTIRDLDIKEILAKFNISK